MKTSKDRIDKFVKMYQEGYTMTEISKIEKARHKTVSKYLKEAGVKLKTNSQLQRKYPVQEDYFSEINSDEKAYWLGFIAADGCVHKNALRISLSTKDINHLEKLKNILSPSRTLMINISKYSSTPLCTLEIKSLIMIKDLKKYGIVSRKTFLLNDLPSISLDLIPSYIRGYFDGDGCIHIRKEKENHKGTAVLQILGNLLFLEKIKIIFNNLGCTNTKLCLAKKKTNNQTYQYSKGGNLQVYKIYKYLYQNSTVHLERKFLKFKLLLGALDSDI